MLMRREAGPRPITHETGRARPFSADAVEHHAFDTVLGRGDPTMLGAGYRGTTREIGVDTHGIFSREFLFASRQTTLMPPQLPCWQRT